MRFAHFTALFLFVSSTLFWSIHAGQFLKDFLESSAKWRHHSISDCDIRVAMDLSQSKAENNIVEPRDFHSLGLRYLTFHKMNDISFNEIYTAPCFF